MRKKQRRVLSELDLMEHAKHDPEASATLKEFRRILGEGHKPIAYRTDSGEYGVTDEDAPPTGGEKTDSPLR